MPRENYDLESQGDGYRNSPKPANVPVDPTFPLSLATKWKLGYIILASTLIYMAFGLYLQICLEPSQLQHRPQVELKPAPNVVVLKVSDNQLTANWDIVFRFRNPSKFTVSFDQVKVLLFDGRDHKLMTSPFVLAPKEELQDVHAAFEDVTTEVDGWNHYDGTGQGTSGVTTLNATVTVARYKSTEWFSKKSVEANCDNIRVLFSSNSNVTTIVGSKDCTVNYPYKIGDIDIADKISIYGGIIVVCLGIVWIIILWIF